MKKDYLLPGIIALFLAIIFPVYWVLMFNSRLEEVANWAGLIQPKLDIYSWVFLFIGAISIRILRRSSMISLILKRLMYY